MIPNKGVFHEIIEPERIVELDVNRGLDDSLELPTYRWLPRASHGADFLSEVALTRLHDLAIDFHTGTTGLDAAAFHIGDMRIPDVKTMMMLYPVAAIWDTAAYPGVLHNAYIAAGIPCFTPEVGVARRLDLVLQQPSALVRARGAVTPWLISPKPPRDLDNDSLSGAASWLRMQA